MSSWGYGSATHSLGTAGTASTVILVANADAEYRLFQNDSNAVIYLGLGAAAVLNSGLRLNVPGSAGWAYEMTKGKGNLHIGTVQAISTAGGKVILITEGV